MRTCDTTGCDKAHRARGLCSTHYNQTHVANRHTKTTRACDWCGSDCIKDVRGTERYAHTYCSLACRDNGRRVNGETCDLPADHWARMYGATCQWTPPLPPKASYQCGTCEDCSAQFLEPTGQTPSVYCSQRCQDRTHRRRRRAREHNAPGEFRYSEVMRIYIKQGKVCAYCEQPVIGLPDPEHVMPLSRGGRNDTTNLVAACRLCNSDKCDLTLTEWATDRQRRGLQPMLMLDVTSPTFKHLVLSTPDRPASRHSLTA